MSSRTIQFILLLTLLGWLTTGCAPAAASSETQSTHLAVLTIQANCPPETAPDSACITPTTKPPTNSPTATATVSPTPKATETPAPSPTPPPPTATPCPPNLCSYAFTYFLQRPIALPGNDIVDATYRFGVTQGGRRDPHHGVEFLNGHGTPVLAAAEGTVFFAGEDREPISEPGAWPQVFYGPYSNFYGKLVIIEHQAPEAMLQVFPQMPTPIFTVYAHLSEISVETGHEVQVGQEIGKVGMTGIAEGSHLHFEVRLGEALYANVRNPEIWLAPHQDRSGQLNGGLTGSIVDSQGQPIFLENSLVLEHLPLGPDQPGGLEVYLQDYEEAALAGQPPFADSFGVGDIPPGLYRLTFPRNGLQQVLVEVFPGQLTWIWIQVE
jgi:murein DD-endopeptidase MepM/ murein hydrolase activator NlpD